MTLVCPTMRDKGWKLRGMTVLLALGAALLLAEARFAEAADAVRGRDVFKQCASCHQVGKGAKNGVGPHLNGIFGRRAGTIGGAKYSTDMTRAGQIGLHWGFENLDVYLADPKSLISGTMMQFRGLKDPRDRADVLAYLRQFSDNPRDIPEAARTASHDPAVDPAVLALKGDPAYGEYLGGECVTCHQKGGEDKGIPSIVGWPTDVFVTAMHAYRSKVRANPVMRLVAGPLSDEEIAALAAYFEGLGK